MTTLTRVKEQYPFEASKLNTVHVEVVEPVGQLAEHSLEDTSDLWVLYVVFVAGETVGEENGVRFGTVASSDLEHTVLAPAGFEKLDLVVEA